ncbi:MAG: trypsin-like peptidase domain-containing protein [Actinomycetota bacterium]
MTDESHCDDDEPDRAPSAASSPDLDPLDEITAELELDDDAEWGSAEWASSPLPMEDRLWRHPSEIRLEKAAATGSSRSGLRTLVGVAVGAGLIGALVSAVMVRSLTDDPDVVVERRMESTAIALEQPGIIDASAIATAVSPGVVRITVLRSGSERANGSGVVFRSDGLVLTNAHVVRDAVAMEVTLADGRSFQADLVGVDDYTDIAVLDIDGDGLSTVIMADDPALAVGQPALAIGSPLGLEGGPSVTLGVVSALGRNLDSPTGQRLYDLIQTDAPIAPGSSGGALVDGSGALIGLTTAIGVSDVGAEGVSFATPITIAYDVAVDLLDDGVVDHAWLGITGRDLGPANDGATPHGVEVMSVAEGGPAAVAGLSVGDVIMAADGDDLRSMSELIGRLLRLSPGATLPLQLDTGRLVDVELGTRPDTTQPSDR